MAHEKQVRMNEWGVAIDFGRTAREQREPKYNHADLPPEVILPDGKTYAMVHIVFEATKVDAAPGKRRVHFEAMVYPRPKDIAVDPADWQKIDQKLPVFKALLAEFVNHRLPVIHADAKPRIELLRWIRKECPPTEMPEATSMTIDWLTPVKHRRLEEEREYAERQIQAMCDAASRTELREPDWPLGMQRWEFMGIGALIRAYFSKKVYFPATPVQVPSVPEFTEVPEVDPWEEMRFTLPERRMEDVDRALDSLYSQLVIKRDGGTKEFLRKSGLASVFHHTRIADPGRPLSKQVWGQSNTLVLGGYNYAGKK